MEVSSFTWPKSEKTNKKKQQKKNNQRRKKKKENIKPYPFIASVIPLSLHDSTTPYSSVANN
jgi:hypothetical protein